MTITRSTKSASSSSLISSHTVLAQTNKFDFLRKCKNLVPNKRMHQLKPIHKIFQQTLGNCEDEK